MPHTTISSSGNVEHRPDLIVVGRESRLRTGVQPPRPRRHHDVLQEHAVVDPRALVEAAVDGEDHADRRVEEDEVAVVLGAHLVDVAPADAELAVKREADRAAAACR